MTMTAEAMKATCPSCHSTFPVDPARVPVDGILAICSTCLRTFPVHRPEGWTPSLAAGPARFEEDGTRQAEAPPVEDAVGFEPQPSPAEDEGTSEAEATLAEEDGTLEAEASPASSEEAAEVRDSPAAFDPAPEVDESVAVHDASAEEAEAPEAEEPLPELGADRDDPAPRTEAEVASDEPGDLEVDHLALEGDAEGTSESDAPGTLVEEVVRPPSTGWDRGEEAPAPLAGSAADEREVDPGEGGPGEAPSPLEDEPSGDPAPGSPAPTFTFGRRDPENRARRLARVLASDMITYNPARYAEARRRGSLREDFQDEIEKSWEEYVDQVGEELARSTDHFAEALNEVLAQGETLFRGPGKPR